MPLADRLARAWTALRTPEAKASATAPMVFAASNGVQWPPRRFDRFALEGYVENVVAYRCIRLIASGIASLQLMATRDGDELSDTDPLTTLLRRPNPMQSGARLWEGVVAYLLIAGNSYVEVVRAGRGGVPRELHCLRPDRITIDPSAAGWPSAYVYEAGGQKRRFEVDRRTGLCDVLHLREFHPVNDHFGLSPTEAAARSIDQHNAAGAHNAALLQNGASPAGILTVKSATGIGAPPPPGPEEMRRVEMLVRERHEGARNAGKTLILGGDWSWLSQAMSNRDMDFLNLDLQKAREICAAYNVPHPLVVPGESTYSNREQAREELWEATILPLADLMFGDVAGWLGAMTGTPGLNITYDRDAITALERRRTAHRQQVVAEWDAGLIKRNEARLALQHEPLTPEEGGEDLISPTRAQADESALALMEARKPPVQPGEEEADDEDEEGAVPPKKAARPFERKALDPDDVAAELPDGEMTEELLPRIRETLGYFGQRAIDMARLGIAFDVLDPAVVKFLESYGAERITGLIGETTREAIRTTLREGVEAGESMPKLVARVRQAFEAASFERARLIAETETGIAAGFGSQRGLVQSGATHKRWLSTYDGRVRDSHKAMQGQIKAVEEPFISGAGNRLMYPGDGPASEAVRCRCASLIYVVGIDGPDPGKMDPEAEWRRYDAARRMFEVQVQEGVRRGFEVQGRAIAAAVMRRLS